MTLVSALQSGQNPTINWGYKYLAPRMSGVAVPESDFTWGLSTQLVKRHLRWVEKRIEVGLIMCQHRQTDTVKMTMRNSLRRSVGLEGYLMNRGWVHQIQNAKSKILMQRCGFTIIEILIVVFLIGIAAMMAVPMMSSAGSMQIRSAANMIAADLEYAKSMAISRGQNFSVVFDKTNEKYQIEDQNGTVIPHPVKKGFNYTISFQSDNRLNRVLITDAVFEPDSSQTITFDYLGSPYSGTSNPLNSGIITLQAGDFAKTVRIEPVTGYISITD